MARTWTTEQETILREHYPTSTDTTLLALFPDKKLSAIKSKAMNLKLRREKQRFYFSDYHVEKLREIYSTTLNKDIAELFQCPVFSIENKAFRLGLKKSPELISETARIKISNPNHPGRKHLFKKGHATYNKGKKQQEYMSQESIERTKATQYKKGNVPSNHKPIGYERISKDGYIEVKAAEPNIFITKHRLVWMEHYGEIPPGHIIQFKDQNKRNFDPDNLEMISRGEQMKTKNSYHARYPKEIQLLFQLKGALKRQINKANNKDQDNGNTQQT